MNAKDAALSNKISDLEEKIDKLTNQTLLNCPSGWINEDGIGCFYFGTTNMTWQNARNHCKSIAIRADLAEIHNAETNAFLLNSIVATHNSTDYWWIGGSDEAQVVTQPTKYISQFDNKGRLR